MVLFVALPSTTVELEGGGGATVGVGGIGGGEGGGVFEVSPSKKKPFTINCAPSAVPPVLSYDPRKKRTK